MSTPATAPWHAQSVGNRVQFTPPPKTLKQPTEVDLAAVANGESLQLLETWQGSFTGSKLLKAGLLRFSSACMTLLLLCSAHKDVHMLKMLMMAHRIS